MRRCLLLLCLAGCQPKDPPAITAAWRDDFQRADLGPDYRATADAYAIKDGVLNVKGAENHPLWLRRRIPRDAVIELDCWSTTDDGDIKVEIWGDGASYSTDRIHAYTSTGYVFIHGGWSNTTSIIARGNEHEWETDPSMPRRTEPKVEKGRHYHWKIVRKAGHIDWFIDDLTTPFLTFDDPAPLSGGGHEYFGFTDWHSSLWFDDLAITPL